jgi:hypothetical protein
MNSMPRPREHGEGKDLTQSISSAILHTELLKVGDFSCHGNKASQMSKQEKNSRRYACLVAVAADGHGDGDEENKLDRPIM